jgi:hypothetical protein
MATTLLSVGTNHSLLGIRNLVLVKSGFNVIPAKSAAAALNVIQTAQLHAVVVGHSLSRSLKEQVTWAAKQKSLAVIVLHTNPYEQPVANADANLCGIDGAARIVDVLRELLARSGQPPTNHPLTRENKGASVFRTAGW